MKKTSRRAALTMALTAAASSKAAAQSNTARPVFIAYIRDMRWDPDPTRPFAEITLGQLGVGPFGATSVYIKSSNKTKVMADLVDGVRDGIKILTGIDVDEKDIIIFGAPF